jgi:hypothetical protein
MARGRRPPRPRCREALRNEVTYTALRALGCARRELGAATWFVAPPAATRVRGPQPQTTTAVPFRWRVCRARLTAGGASDGEGVQHCTPRWQPRPLRHQSLVVAGANTIRHQLGSDAGETRRRSVWLFEVRKMGMQRQRTHRQRRTTGQRGRSFLSAELVGGKDGGFGKSGGPAAGRRRRGLCCGRLWSSSRARCKDRDAA